MKKVLVSLIAIGLMTALVVGAFFAGKKSGTRYGAVNHAIKQCGWAMRAGSALATNNYDRTARLIFIMLTEAEAEMLRFDNKDLIRDDFLSREHARYDLAATLLDLDAYWEKHPRVVSLGARVDETNIQKYGLAGGATINAEREFYERAYSNAISRARGFLGK